MLSITNNQHINIGERNNTNNIKEFFKSRIRVPDTTLIFKKNYIQESLLFESKSLKPISKLRSSQIVDNIICNIEGLSNKISNSNLLFIFKIPQSLYNSEVNGHLKNSKFLKDIYFPKDTILASCIDFIRSASTLRVLEVLISKKMLNNQYLLNDASSLNSNIFSTYIDYWSKPSFSNVLLQLRNIFSKTSNDIYSQNFTEKLMGTVFSAAKEMTEFKIVNSPYYYNKYSKLLKENKIKNQVLIFSIKVPEDIPDKIKYKYSMSMQLSKSLHFLIDNTFLKEQKFIKNLVTSKISKLSAIKNDLYSDYFSNSLSNQHGAFKNDLSTKYFFNIFSNQRNTLDSSSFSTDFKNLNNISFTNTVHQLCNKFLSETSSQVNSKIFPEKPLRMDLSTAKKVTGFETKNDDHYFSPKPNLLKTNRIKNPVLTFVIKSHESLPDQVTHELLENRTFLKTPHFLNNFLNQGVTLNSIAFSTSTDIYHLNNIGFSNTVRQLRNKFLSEASSQVNSKDFSGKSLKIFFSAAKKMTEFKIVNSRHYSFQNKKLFKENKAKNPVLMFPIKVPEDIPDKIKYKYSMSMQLSKSLYFLIDDTFLKEQKFMKNLVTSKISKLSAIKNDLYSDYFSNSLSNQHGAFKNDLSTKYFFNIFSNQRNTLDSSSFSTDFKNLNNISFTNTVRQLRNKFLLEASSQVNSKIFPEKPLRMDLSTAKKVTGFETKNDDHYFSQKPNLLKTNRIKNPVLTFVIKSHESLPDQVTHELLENRTFLKTPHFLNNFLNQGVTLNSIAFSTSTDIYHLNNIGFSNIVRQLRNKFLSEASSQVNSKDFSGKSLKIFFSAAKKMTEFKVTGNEHYSTQKSKMFKGQGSGNASPEFGDLTAFPFRLPNLSLENLIFPGRNTQFSFLISQKPAIVKNNLILSLPDLEIGFKRIAPVYMKKDLPVFASGNEISGLEHSKNHNFRINAENLVFITQSDMEQRIEEKIEQKIRQKIEQIKKASADVKEASVTRYLSDHSATREFQKQFLDINYISDQVFRMMEHRLKIERERRGIL